MIMKPSFDSMLCVPLCCCETGSDTGVSLVAVTFFITLEKSWNARLGNVSGAAVFMASG